MKTYEVTYDLRQPGRDYRALFAALMSYGAYWHVMDSVWILRTNRSAGQIRDHLMGHMDGNDQLLVVGLDGEAAWYGLPVDGSNWLKQQLAA